MRITKTEGGPAIIHENLIADVLDINAGKLKERTYKK